jgi:hypothetical protein
MIDTVARLGHSAVSSAALAATTSEHVCLTAYKGWRRRFKRGLLRARVDRVAFVTYFRMVLGSLYIIFSDTPATAAKAPDASIFQGAKFFHIMGCSLMASATFGREIVKRCAMPCKRAKVSLT